MANMNVLDLAKQSLKLSDMPDNAIANYNKQLEDKYKELESIINTDTKAERDYITKHPSQRDQYDIAF